MAFETKVPYGQAEDEVNSFLDKKNLLPKRRQAIQEAADNVAEAISYGLVTINADGTITQKLITPIGATHELQYAARVEPAEMQRAISRLPSETATTIHKAYLKAHTGLTDNTINKLEGQDSDIASWITLFFR